MTKQDRPKISVIVTDLDNTLFDWFSPWYYSFSALLEQLEHDSGISRDTLLKDIKRIHQRHGTAEYNFVIEEIPSLRNKYPGQDLAVKFRTAIERYRTERNKHLKRYPGVLGTLQTIKHSGCLIVGYTESMALYTNLRVKSLGLDGILDYLYSPEDHDFPRELSPTDLEKYPSQPYTFEKTIHRHTPPGELKPNPKNLLDIIEDIGGLPIETAYIGDNLWKDVQMAQKAGVFDVYAEYGSSHQTEEYELLKAVTHWTDADVRRENELKREHVNPAVTLHSRFDEILDKFHFVPTVGRKILFTQEGRKDQVAVWQSIVDVQKHFNDIEMKIRNLALIVVGAVVAGVGFSVERDISVQISDISLQLASIVLGSGALVLFAFWFMDRHWYHRLLLGSVLEGRAIEQDLTECGLKARLTDSIGAQSPFEFWGHRIHSEQKIDLFYGWLGGLLLSGAAFFVRAEYGAYGLVAVAMVSIGYMLNQKSY